MTTATPISAEAQIRQMNDEFSTAVRARDLDRMLALAYADVGEGPAILFIHGFMFDHTMWRDQVAALDGRRRIAPDLRGMGESDAPDSGYERLRRMMTRTPVSGIVGALEAMRDRSDSQRLLPTLSGTPTLLIVGERDARTPRSSMQAMAGQIPDARLQIIAGAGHLPPMEQPEATTSTLRAFLAGLSERT